MQIAHFLMPSPRQRRIWRALRGPLAPNSMRNCSRFPLPNTHGKRGSPRGLCRGYGLVTRQAQGLQVFQMVQTAQGTVRAQGLLDVIDF